jgi:hypothetical protein
MSEAKKPDAPWQQFPGKLELDLWSTARNEIRTVGTFGWVWQEGNSLLAGPGPEFGNADPASRVVAHKTNELWWPLGADGKILTETGYSDFGVQPADPLRFSLADLVEAATQLCGTGEDSEYNRALIDLVELMLGDEGSILTRRKRVLGLLGFAKDGE